MKAFYNDIEQFCVRWLKNLVLTGEISPGDVSSVSITELEAWQLVQYTRVHLCAGIGGWDLALQLAGWPMGLPVWTASFPCQPFSAAGKQEGENDVRHIWPVGRELIKQCKPSIIFGEQVASKLGREWLSGVRSDLEALGYAVGAADLCSPGVGAPHIRQRLYWTAIWRGESDRDGRQQGRITAPPTRQRHTADSAGSGVCSSGLAYSKRDAGEPGRVTDRSSSSLTAESAGAPTELGRCGDASRLEHAESQQEGVSGQPRQPRRRGELGGLGDDDDARLERRRVPSERSDQLPSRSSGMGFWNKYDIVNCLDGKARRIISDSQLLANGFPSNVGVLCSSGTFPKRVGLLRGFGNAIVPQLAAKFVKSVMEVLNIEAV